MKINIYRKILLKIGTVISFAVLLSFSLFPVYWLFLTSIKQKKDWIVSPAKFIFKPTFEHWKSVLFSSDFVQYYKNSLIIVIGVVIVTLVVGIMAAYSLARGKYKFRENLSFFILSQKMMPAVAIALPVYIIASRLGALDHLETLIFINIAFNLPLAVWMLKGYIQGLSLSIEDSALVDGCSRIGAFIRIGIPQILPGIMSTILLTFIYTFNEFFFALILSGTNSRPVTVAVMGFLPTGVRGTMFGEAAVASILIMVPTLILAVFMQRYLVKGISLGSVKE